MAGHSKWANIKHSKQAADAKRGKLYTKLAKEIAVAARLGGGDQSSNPRLRRAVQSARVISMPKDNIERAIKRGTGELEGVDYEEITLEGYGLNGVAILADCLTDNRNRTVADVRSIFNKGKGNMGKAGSVGWIFETKGEIVFDLKKVDNEALQVDAINSGACDLDEDGDKLTVYTEFETYEAVRETLEKKGYEALRSAITKIPKSSIEVDAQTAEVIIKLIEKLEDYDDVQNVYSNFDCPDEELAKITGGT